MPPFGIGCSFKSRHFGFDFTFVWWLLGLSGQVLSTQRDKGGTAGKVGNLRPADFLRGAGYACFFSLMGDFITILEAFAKVRPQI